MNSFKFAQPKKRNFSFVIAAIFFFSIASCKKGDTGPAGSANVVFSDWFKPAAWIKDTVFDIYGFNYSQAAPEITQNILDSGTVIVYGKLDGYNPVIWATTQVSQLPIILNYKFSPGGITYTDTWSALTTLKNIKIRFVDDQNYYSSIATAHQFRYIVIPGAKKTASIVERNIITRSGNILNTGTLQDIADHYTNMSYGEVCSKLGIPQ